MSLWKIYRTFAEMGAVCFGGGYAMLSLVQRVIVEEHGWATEEELMDYYAIGQCTPGVIAVNVSTFIGQFFDNFLFSIMVFTVFAPIFWDGFSWTVLQCAMCALTGAVAELIMEILFSPIGYRICRRWRENAVGREYLEFMESESL